MAHVLRPQPYTSLKTDDDSCGGPGMLTIGGAAKEIAAFTKLEHLGHNNRPIQSLGGRVVLVDSTPDK